MKWITAQQLEAWAKVNSARAVFPELIGDLIRASASELRAFRFVSGDKSQVRGFDGYLEAVGVPPYVPDGDSIWEFGVGEGASTKANDDYKKRTNKVAADKRANTTFVFVSPWTWDNPKKRLDEWLKEKRDKKEWKSVEYIDGAQLETWLSDLAPEYRIPCRVV
jgi:hypothetical protein